MYSALLWDKDRRQAMEGLNKMKPASVKCRAAES